MAIPARRRAQCAPGDVLGHAARPCDAVAVYRPESAIGGLLRLEQRIEQIAVPASRARNSRPDSHAAPISSSRGRARRCRGGGGTAHSWKSVTMARRCEAMTGPPGPSRRTVASCSTSITRTRLSCWIRRTRSTCVCARRACAALGLRGLTARSQARARARARRARADCSSRSAL